MLADQTQQIVIFLGRFAREHVEQVVRPDPQDIERVRRRVRDLAPEFGDLKRQVRRGFRQLVHQRRAAFGAAVGEIEEIRGGEGFDPNRAVGETEVVVGLERKIRVPELFDSIAVIG